MAAVAESWWTARQGPGPILATAIHNGHELGREVEQSMAIAECDRLREEDPFTGDAVTGVPTHLVVHLSRFQVDLNRTPQSAVYRTSDQSWGLDVWKAGPDDALVERSLAIHSDYYRMLGSILDAIAIRHDRFVLLDVHSYNHRREGPDCEPAPKAKAPDINIGTFSMPRDHWAFLIDPLIESLRSYDFNGRTLVVGENVAFEGRGYQARFVHERFPLRGCAIALEFKKFYMNEWTGQPDRDAIEAMRRCIGFIAETCESLL